MYFNTKMDSNIDLEFEGKKKPWMIKYKMAIIILVVILIVVICGWLLFKPEKSLKHENMVNYFIDLKGENTVTIYQDSEYIEIGYMGYDDKGNDLTSKVIIKDNINTKVVGNYEVTYTLGKTVKTRKINVVEKPIGLSSIYLKGDVTIYLKVFEKYVEPGYIVIDSIDNTLTDKVVVNSNVDTSRSGVYKIVYSVVNSSGVTTQAERTVIVLDAEISLTLENNNYTNGDVWIKVMVLDNFFDYLILPDGNRSNERNYSYRVSKNGTYKFISYNKLGDMKESSITVGTIDKEKPKGSCSGSYSNGKSVININATDNIGIDRYVINGKNYTGNQITFNSEVSKVSITVYDKAGNTNTISCNLQDKNIYGNIANVNPSHKPIQKNKNVSVNYYTSSRNKSFTYWFYAPDKIASNMPIIVFLHGLGEIGNDYITGNSLAISWGPLHEVIDYGYKYNALIINPQVPYNNYVQDVTRDIIELINEIANEFHANKNKISIMGFSHGCYGLMQIVSENPNYFSSAVAIGCTCNHSASNFVNTPLWTFVGSGDGVNSMPAFVEEVNRLGGNAKHTRVQGRPHNLLNDNYSILRDSNYNVINWMISNSK